MRGWCVSSAGLRGWWAEVSLRGWCVSSAVQSLLSHPSPAVPCTAPTGLSPAPRRRAWPAGHAMLLLAIIAGIATLAAAAACDACDAAARRYATIYTICDAIMHGTFQVYPQA